MRYSIECILKQNQGSAIIELAIILPLFMLLLCTAIDFARITSLHQELSSIVREASNSTYRHCLQRYNSRKSLEQLQESIGGALASGKEQLAPKINNKMQLCAQNIWRHYNVYRRISTDEKNTLISIFECNDHSCKPQNCVDLSHEVKNQKCLVCDCKGGLTTTFVGQDRSHSRFWKNEIPLTDKLTTILNEQGAVVVAESTSTYPEALIYIPSKIAYEVAVF